MVVAVHQFDDFLAGDEFGITGSQFVLARRDLLPAVTRERGVFHRVAGGIPEKLASGVEALLLPCRVDIVEKRLTKPGFVLLLIYHVGMRKSALLSIDRENVKPGGGIIEIRNCPERTGVRIK